MFSFIQDLATRKTKKQYQQKIALTAVLASFFGAIVAFFFSPNSGKENRNQVKKTVSEAEKSAKEFYEKQGVPFVKKTQGEFQEAIDDVIKKLEKINKAKADKKIELIEEGESEEKVSKK
jgi:gas vesicle protein